MVSRSEDDEGPSTRGHASREICRILGLEPPAGLADLDGPKARMVAASAIAPERIEWLWPGRIPLGTPTLFSGDPKRGKSLASLALIAAVTRGGPLPGPAGSAGPATATRGSAILLSAEDDPARVIVPRLRAAGADMERVHILSTIIEPASEDPDAPDERTVAWERMPTLMPDDLQVIERRARALGDCRLIVFDPIAAYFCGHHLERSVGLRRVLASLTTMARRLDAAIVLVAHHNKRGGSGTSGMYRVSGRIDSVAACRSNFMFLKDPDDPSGRRVLMLSNGVNLAPGQPALAFVIRDEGAGPFCDWLPETIDIDADAALARAAVASKLGVAGGKFGRRYECEVWLRGLLAGGPKTATECEQAAKEAGFTDSVLLRARMALAVRCQRSGFGKGSCYHWSLPGGEDRSPAPPETDADAHALRAS